LNIFAVLRTQLLQQWGSIALAQQQVSVR